MNSVRYYYQDGSQKTIDTHLSDEDQTRFEKYFEDCNMQEPQRSDEIARWLYQRGLTNGEGLSVGVKEAIERER